MKHLFLVFLNLAFLSVAQASIVCQSNDQNKTYVVSSYTEVEDPSEFMTLNLWATVLVISTVSQEQVREFAIQGTRELMAAGHSDQLKNDEEGFLLREAFNGSLLNSWEEPLTGTLKGESRHCQKN
ncbi:MAG: hypothetical protein ACK5W9_13665 [Bdellovibrionales bacterium]